MKVPFWRLVACVFGMHGPLEGIYKSRRHRESLCPPEKVQCLLCGRVMQYSR